MEEILFFCSVCSHSSKIAFTFCQCLCCCGVASKREKDRGSWLVRRRQKKLLVNYLAWRTKTTSTTEDNLRCFSSSFDSLLRVCENTSRGVLCCRSVSFESWSGWESGILVWVLSRKYRDDTHDENPSRRHHCQLLLAHTLSHTFDGVDKNNCDPKSLSYCFNHRIDIFSSFVLIRSCLWR